MRKLFGDYGLSLTLAVLFIASWLIQSVAGWVEFVSEQSQHQQVAQLLGDDGYLWTWLQATFENWQSEFLQLFTMVVLTAFLIHRHSHESRDSQDKLEAKVDELMKMVKEQSK